MAVRYCESTMRRSSSWARGSGAAERSIAAPEFQKADQCRSAAAKVAEGRQGVPGRCVPGSAKAAAEGQAAAGRGQHEAVRVTPVSSLPRCRASRCGRCRRCRPGGAPDRRCWRRPPAGWCCASRDASNRQRSSRASRRETRRPRGRAPGQLRRSCPRWDDSRSPPRSSRPRHSNSLCNLPVHRSSVCRMNRTSAAFSMAKPMRPRCRRCGFSRSQSKSCFCPSPEVG